ncbi:MAG: hypothetical protein ACHP84_06625 [Caulobacterales bacterium]
MKSIDVPATKAEIEGMRAETADDALLQPYALEELVVVADEGDAHP